MTNEKNEKKEFSPRILKERFGVGDERLLEEIFVKAASAMPRSKGKDQRSHVVAQAVYEMGAKDPIETRLCAKETALYSLAMKYMQRAEAGMFSEESDFASRMWYETIMNYGLKLLRIHNETVETLLRYKRGGEQKVTVQHQYVQVNDGGKAIVSSNMVAGGEGITQKNEEEPHGESMRCKIEDQQSSTMPLEGIAERKVPVSRRKKHRAN